MQLTKNFKLKEFLESVFYDKEQQERVYDSFEKNKSLLDNAKELAENLQVLRDELGCPIHINISYRPVWYEILKGRKGTSRHTLAQAADIRTKKHTTKEIYLTIQRLIDEGKMKEGGLGLYNTFVHYDIRGAKARWKL